MANTYSWQINALDTYPTQDSFTDVVYNIHWVLTATTSVNDEEGNPLPHPTLTTTQLLTTLRKKLWKRG